MYSHSRPDAIYVSKSISTFFCVHIFCKDFWRGGNNLEAYPPYPDRNIVQGSRNGKIIQWQMCDKSSDFCQYTSEVKINIFETFVDSWSFSNEKVNFLILPIFDHRWNGLTQFASSSFYMVAYICHIQSRYSYSINTITVSHRRSCLHFRIHNAWNPFSTQHQF